MNKYFIEQKILTLAECAVMSDQEKPATFLIDEIEFSHINFNYSDGWDTNYWMAKSCIQANIYTEAASIFKKKLSKLVPRISFISQAYIEYLFEPLLIHKEFSKQALIKYFRDTEPVSLAFSEKELKALKILMENEKIPEEFYYYWKDAVNTVGYSAKLLLIFSAIEALAKENGNINFQIVDQILSEKLRIKIYGTEKKSNDALRNRLVHGEYFNPEDSNIDYLKAIHEKMICYFNKKYLNENLISEDVTLPQRHFFGNKNTACWFIKKFDGTTSFELADVLDDFDNNGYNNRKKYIQVFSEEIEKQY